MELRLLAHDEIDRDRWDVAVRESYNAASYGMSWYLDACAPGWAGLVYGDYEQVMCVPITRKLLATAALQPLFVQQVGPFSQTVLTPADVQRFLRFLNRKVGTVTLYLTPQCTGLTGKFRTTVRHSQTVPLHKPLAEIRAGYSENLRRNIHKAQKKGLTLTFTDDAETVIQTFKSQAGGHVTQIGEEGFARLRNLLGALQVHTRCVVPQVRDAEGNLLYTAFFSVFGQRVLYVKGAGTEAAKKNGAGHWLMDAMIAHFHAQNCTVFDFGGAHAENVRNFNRQFGGDEFEYLCFKGGYLHFIL